MPNRNPQSLGDLNIPDQQKMQDVMEALTDEGRADFLQDLYGAIAEAADHDDVSPVQFIVDAWWTSRRFAQHPRFNVAVEAAARSLDTDKRYNSEELREFFASV